ncbi:MAG TPA: type II secretion system F family protein [Dermatophilaceae bacterium]|nr:type II secretion system F family protein [Dermatophilaceae bacterium]
MTALAIGLLFGLGLFSIYSAWWPREPRTRRTTTPSMRERLADELVQAGFDTVRPGHVATAGIVAFLVVLFLAFATIRVLPIAVCFAAMAASAPRAIVGMRARRRRSQLRDLWPDAVDNIASAVRAGLALPEALSQLAIRGPEELRPAFAAFAEDYRATGRFQDCLERLKDRLADPVADRLIESLRIAREVGGSDLGRVLRTLSGFLRDDARTRAELETRQGWTINAARLAAGAPWVVLALLSLQRDALKAYSTPAGVLVLGFGAGITIVAYRLMVRIARLPDDERVLR